MFARALLLSVALLTLSLTIGPSLAAVDASNPITVYTQDSVALAPGGLADQLVARAAAEGTIRVIVGLKLVMLREDVLTGFAQAAQIRRLQAIQDGVIGRVLGAPDESTVRFTFIPYMSLFVTGEEVRRLLADPDVVSLEEDIPVPALASYDYNITVPHIDQVLAKGVSGKGYTVAILDSGVDKTHPMLSGKVVSEACYSTNNSAQGLTSFCPGKATASTATGSGINCPVAIDGCEHGTHVASIAAGKLITAGGHTLTGVARGANIIAIQVFTRDTKNCGAAPKPCAHSFRTDQIKALQHLYALRNSSFKIIAVNMSLGSGKYASVCDSADPGETTAINNLRAVGIGITIASGNDGYDGYIGFPACISSAFAVGNSNAEDVADRYSNNSTLVKVLAPGRKIVAAIPGGKYDDLSGTSMSAPFVAGSIAALKSAKPTATMALMLTALQCSGKMITHREVPGNDPKFLLTPRPRVDLLGALNFLKYSSSTLREWDFSKPAEAMDWTPFWGTWAVSGGLYRETPPKLRWAATSVATCDQPSTVTASLIANDPTTGEPGWFAGVILRANINYKANTVSGYWLAYDRCHANTGGNCTGLPDDPRGQGVVYRMDNVNFLTGAGSWGQPLCAKREPIAVNAMTNLRVVASGAHFSYYLNGALVCSFTNTTYSTGRDMIAFYNNGGAASSMGATSFSIKFANTSASVAEPLISPVMDPSAFAPKPGQGASSATPAG